MASIHQQLSLPSLPATRPQKVYLTFSTAAITACTGLREGAVSAEELTRQCFVFAGNVLQYTQLGSVLMQAGQYAEAEALMHQLLLHVETVRVSHSSHLVAGHDAVILCKLIVSGLCCLPCMSRPIYAVHMLCVCVYV